MKDIVERLRERLITVRKPGAVPFEPGPGWIHTSTIGGNQPPRKVGDSAGYASVNMAVGAASSVPSYFRMVEMVYAEASLEWEAAAEIERLRSARETEVKP